MHPNTALPHRLIRALQAIAEGHNLTTAAHAAGFASHAHFTDAVRARFGVPPRVLLAHGLGQRALRAKAGLQRIDEGLGHVAQLDFGQQVGGSGGGVHGVCLRWVRSVRSILGSAPCKGSG